MMMMDGGGQTLLNQNALSCRAQPGGPIRLAPWNQHQQQVNNMQQQQHQRQQHYAASCSPSQMLRQPHNGQQDSLPVQYITQRTHSNSYQTQSSHHGQQHHQHQNHHVQLQNHNQQPAPAQQQQQMQHSTSQLVYTRRQPSQQQQQQRCQPALVNAPPTPPSDMENMCQPHQSQPIYLEPSDSRQQTGAWVMHTIQQQQQQQSGEHQLQQQQQQQQQQQFQTSQEQTISSYYYDINDFFSDIMSAPSSPEPPMLSEPGRQHGRAHFQHEQQQQQRVQEEELHTNYTNYLPYNQQPGQQHAVYSSDQLQTPPAYTAAMSPDSSALSTTSSSPSDHSLYQASPPMPRNHLSAAALGQRMGARPPMVQHRQQSFQMHALPLSPAEPQQAVKMEPVMQQQQPKLVAPVCQAAPVQQQRSSPIHLWEFLKELLCNVDSGQADASIIRWIDRQEGIFKIEDSVRVAKLWGKRKNKPKMNYDKLSRSIRQYYKKGIMKKTDRSQRLVYQFCSAYCH